MLAAPTRPRLLSLVTLLAATLAATPALASDDDAATPPRERPLDDEVVGGTDVPAGKWQDTAGVSFGGQVGCTGVLVHPRVVLTAGHCIDSSIDNVVLATHDLDAIGEIVPVERAASYPQWFSTFDLGLLVLSREATVAPRTIATDCVRDRYVSNGAQVTIVGYGAIDSQGNEYVNQLQEAVTTITDYDCSSDSLGCQPGARPAGELGAGGMGIDSCFGDSGGPLYLNTELGDFLVGITSRGYDSNTLPCSQGGIYVRPDAVIEWIESESGYDLPRASCNMPPEPTAPSIEVVAGKSGSTQVTPNDPDATDTHTFAIAQNGTYGEATVADDGTVTYRADADYEGSDTVVVAVTDSGDPAQSASVTVAVTVLPGGGGGCCSAAGGPGGSAVLAFLVALVLVGRRRKD